MILYLGMFIAWLGYSYFTGMGDGYFYHMINRKIRVDKDEHTIFTYERSAVVTLFVVGSIATKQLDWLTVLTGAFIPMFTFSFIHGGSYYRTRSLLAKKANDYSKKTAEPNKITIKVKDPYPKGWWDQSHTTIKTKFWTSIMTPEVRTIFFIIGVMAFIGQLARIKCNC